MLEALARCDVGLLVAYESYAIALLLMQALPLNLVETRFFFAALVRFETLLLK